MRTFRSTFEDQEKRYSIRPILRINKQAANYARQSDPYAKRKQSESKEMQTVDIQGWCIEQGWARDMIDPYYADLGLSGTLRPDQRPDMFRLFDNIDQGIYDEGSVICYQESRLFRDETAIYYNQFIDKCLQHDIIVVVISPYIMIYDFRDEFMKEMFRYKCKEAAEFIPRHIKGWLHPARLRAALRGEWAGLGDIPLGLIIDADPDSRTFKRFKPYEPHAEILRTRLFERFQMLGGEINLLYRELSLSPVILPPFEPDVEEWLVKKCKVTKCSGGGYILDNRTIIKSILTNPKYIGYRPVRGYIPRDSQGNKIKAHDGMISEDLFYFAYNRLAKTDLDGNPIENGRKTIRYFHRNNKGKYGLLKFIIEGDGMPVRTRAVGKYDGTSPTDNAVYILEPQGNPSSLAHRRSIEIPCEELDAIIVDRLFEHVRDIAKTQEDLTVYNKKIKEMQSERQKRLAQMNKSLIEVEKEQARLTVLLGKGEQEKKKGSKTNRKLSDRAQELMLNRIDDLEEERKQIIRDIDELQERIDGDIGSLEDEVRDLEANWSRYDFEKRRALVQYLTVKVLIDVVSTHWIKIDVTWLHESWSREEMYYQRRRGKNADWTEEELSIVQAYYATMPKGQLMSLLPHRGWFGIRQCGSRLGIERMKGRPEEEEKTKQMAWLYPYPGDRVSSYSDLEFMRSKGMDERAARTKWKHVSELSSGAWQPS